MNTNTTMYTHAYKPGSLDPSRYYWEITVPGDHSSFYSKHGYATLVNYHPSGPSVMPQPFETDAEFDARCDAFEKAYDDHIEEMACGY
jgi:hypothetical protein